jgi:hypothetical protein
MPDMLFAYLAAFGGLVIIAAAIRATVYVLTQHKE